MSQSAQRLEHFNPRSREGSDSYKKLTGTGAKQISILAPARGATLSCVDNVQQEIISILAPARGATPSEVRWNKIQPKFQSSLPRGERPFSVPPDAYSVQHFNPRSREGSDPVTLIAAVQEKVISILAPARGATPHCGIMLNVPPISILAPARGATEFCSFDSHEFTFQSSLQRGERQIWHHSKTLELTFQSSLPRGERHL